MKKKAVKFVFNTLLGFSESHLPYWHRAVTGARSSSKDQQEIRQVPDYITIFLIEQVSLCAAPLFAGSFVLKSQTVSNQLCIFTRQDLFTTVQFWGFCECFATVAFFQAERLQLDSIPWSYKSERCRETLVLEGPEFVIRWSGLESWAGRQSAGVWLVAGTQSSAAVVNLVWGARAWERGNLPPGLSGEAVPPQEVLWRVLALTSPKEKHTVPVGHSWVAHQSGGTGPEENNHRWF